jgi:hypothetical protein
MSEQQERRADEEALNESNLVLDSLNSSMAVAETPVVIGDRVVVHGTFGGYLRYWGPVLFSHGLWAGVELDEPG